LKEHNISSAAYHGGKLNGVDYRELIQLAKHIFSRFENHLLSITHADRCSDDKIINSCRLHGDICSMLDFLASKLRLKSGEPGEKDYEAVHKCLAKLHELWALARLNSQNALPPKPWS